MRIFGEHRFPILSVAVEKLCSPLLGKELSQQIASEKAKTNM